MPIKTKEPRVPHVYIIDSPLPDDHEPLQPPAANVKESDHRFSCRIFEDVIRDQFGCGIKRFYCPARQKEDTFFRRIRAELRGKTAKDLLVFFYHGRAGGKYEEYTWEFTNPSCQHIDAHLLIQDINRSEADILFIFECDVPPCMKTGVWERSHPGITDFVCLTGILTDTKNRTVEGEPTFTEIIVSALQEWAAGIENDKHRRKKYYGTLPEVMANSDMSYRPMAFQVEYSGDEETRRIRIGASRTMKGTLEFYSSSNVQGTVPEGSKGDTAQTADGANSDEGYPDPEEDVQEESLFIT